MKKPFNAIATCAASLTLLATGAQALELSLIGRYGQTDPEVFDGSAAEIPTYDPATQRVFVTNAATSQIDAIDISDPENPVLAFSIELPGDPNSVVFTGGVLAVALAADPKTDPGSVAFYDADGNPVGTPVTVGALPDAITVSPDGDTLVTSNEGEPNDDNTIDPEGSISIIDISGGVESATVQTVTFEPFNSQEASLKRRGVRIFGQIFEITGFTDPSTEIVIEIDPETGEEVEVEVEIPAEPIYAFDRFTTVAEDLEPEYAAISEDSSTAFVTLQENNAVAVVDLDSATITAILPLGLKNHLRGGNGLDASNRDDLVGNIRQQRVLGMYQPDAIATYTFRGQDYFVTSNEGDSRDYDNFSEEIRGDDLLDEGFVPFGARREVADDAELGRLKTTIAPPETAIVFERGGTTYLRGVVAYGARSFSIFSADGRLVYDSGDDFEQLTLATVPDIFNATNDDPEADDRSDDKGPEPEGVIVAEIDGRVYAFITLERVGGTVVYDVTDPLRVEFVEYENTRLFADQDGVSSIDDDLGPESLVYIDEEDSPNGQGLLVVTNEVSGSTLIFAVDTEDDDDEDDDEDDEDDD